MFTTLALLETFRAPQASPCLEKIVCPLRELVLKVLSRKSLMVVAQCRTLEILKVFELVGTASLANLTKLRVLHICRDVLHDR